MQTDADCGLIFTTPRRDSRHRRDGGDGSLLEGHPPADREPCRRDCHIAGHRGCRWGSVGECHGGEDAADGVGPQTEDRRQPAAEAQWGCVLACAENTARMEHRKPPGADRGTGSGAADGEGCVGPGGAGVTVVAGTAWRR